MAGEQTENTAVSDELEAIARQAEGMESAVDDGEFAEVAQANPGQEWADTLQLVTVIAAPAWPFVPEIYTPERCQVIGEAMAKVAEKYGFSMGGLMDKWGPEIGLVLAVSPTIVPMAAAMRQQREAKQKAIEAMRQVQQAQQPPAPTVEPEAEEKTQARAALDTFASNKMASVPLEP